MVARRKIPNHQ